MPIHVSNVMLYDEKAKKGTRVGVEIKDGKKIRVSKKSDKKFDFIMLQGNSLVLNDFRKTTQKRGGAYIQIAKRYLTQEPNMMVFVAPDDVIRDAVSTIEKSRIHFAIIKESQTTSFIDIDFSSDVKLPNFIKSALKPFYNANEIVLSAILISVEEDGDVGKVQSIATSNRIFVIDFRDIVTED